MLDYSTLDTIILATEHDIKPHPLLHCDNATVGEHYIYVSKTIPCKSCGVGIGRAHHNCYEKLFGKPAWVCECVTGGYSFYFDQDSGVVCKCYWCGNKLCTRYR
jgi:hypothetical protein